MTVPTNSALRLPREAVAGVLALILALILAGAAFVLLEPADRGARADTGDGDDDPLVGPDYYANPAAVCGLLDREELEVALGRPFAPGMQAPPDTPALYAMPGSVRCVYSAGLAGASGWVGISVVYAYTDQVVEHTLEFRADRDIRTVEVAGLGDRAVLSGGDLLVLEDDKLLGIHLAIETPTEADRWVYTRRLAEKALSRLH